MSADAGILVRDGLPDDAPGIHVFLQRLAVLEGGAADMTATTTDLHDALFVADPSPIGAMVAIRSQAIVGCLIWERTFSSWACRPVIRILDLYVDGAGRGSGVGTLLFEGIVERARGMGCVRLDWWVRSDNDAAQRFYRGQGAGPADRWQSWRLSL